MAYCNYGFLYRTMGHYNRAIHCLDKALLCFEKGTDYVLETYYQKVRCLIKIRNYHHYAEILEEGTKLAKDSDVYTILFNMLKCMADPNIDNAEHLREEILPYLIKNNYASLALDCCIFLREFYMNAGKGYKKRALEMGDAGFVILAKMIEGGK